MGVGLGFAVGLRIIFYRYYNDSVLLFGQIIGLLGCKFWLQISSVLGALNDSDSDSDSDSDAIVWLK